MQPIRVILVPYDFTEPSEAALDIAVTLAAPFEAELHLAHVIHPPSYVYGSEFLTLSSFQVPDLLADSERRLRAVADDISSAVGRVEVHVLEGVPVADTLSDLAASLHADLITMGTHGRTGLAHLLRGSVAERTLRRAHCPVLTVPIHEYGWHTGPKVGPRMASSARW